MKNKLIFIMFTFLFVLESFGFAQLKKAYLPCSFPYKQDRTIEEGREYLLRDGIYFDNLRVAYVKAVTQFMHVPLSDSKEAIGYIFDRTILVHNSYVIPENYENGVRVGDEVVFKNVVGAHSEYWFGIEIDGVLHIFAKAACLNPQIEKIQIGKKEESTPLVEVSMPETINKREWKDEEGNYFRSIDTVYIPVYVEQYQIYESYQVPMMTYSFNQQPYVDYWTSCYSAPCSSCNSNFITINNNNYIVNNNTNTNEPSFDPDVNHGTGSDGRGSNNGTGGGGRGSGSNGSTGGGGRNSDNGTGSDGRSTTAPKTAPTPTTRSTERINLMAQQTRPSGSSTERQIQRNQFNQKKPIAQKDQRQAQRQQPQVQRQEPQVQRQQAAQKNFGSKNYNFGGRAYVGKSSSGNSYSGSSRSNSRANSSSGRSGRR